MLKNHTLNSPDNQKWLKAIGLFQIIGGSLGLILIFNAIIRDFRPTSISVLLIAFLLFGFSVFAGQQIYTLKENSLTWTSINQALQIFSVFAGRYGYQYVSGVCLNVTVDLSAGLNLGADFRLSYLNFVIGSHGEQYFFGINFIAVYIIYKIEKIKTKKELQKA